MNFLVRLLCLFIPVRKWRKAIRRGRGKWMMFFIHETRRVQKEYRGCKNFISSRQAAKMVVVYGLTKVAFGYIRGAMANILSSQQEGLPTVLIEGAACGTLNVASDCKSGPREILMDGEAGVLFPVGDYRKLSQFMSDIFNKKIDVKKMTNNAKRGLNRFDAKEVAKQFLKVL